MMEIESAPLKNPGPWRAETAKEGYSGTSYYVARDHRNVTDINSIDESTSLAYRVLITQPGNYRLGIRNYYEHQNMGEDNDHWTRLDDRPWIKTWSHRFHDQDGDYTWTWETGHDTGGDTLLFPVFENVAAGEHTVYIAVRSANWCIDRLYLVKVDYDRARYYENPPESYGDYHLFDAKTIHRLDYPLSLTTNKTIRKDDD